ncbi:hypothetical protein [Comamonas testosteroni]|uniref:hypothetical protein n=1 Tax=Comamonas testosteroni TaxID=285 RepID=UPI0026F048FE|nr:hypothetical protein [Comamonas testosteroni]
MSRLVPFDIYRTESLKLNGEQFTVHFSKSNNDEAYELFAINNDESKNLRASFSSDTAANFSQLHAGRQLEDLVYKILRTKSCHEL